MGKLVKNIQRQVLISLNIKEHVFLVNFVVIKDHVNDLILGVDFLKAKSTILNFIISDISFRLSNADIKIKFDNTKDIHVQNMTEDDTAYQEWQ